MDSYNGDNKIDRQEFASSLQSLGVNLRPTDLTLLFSYFDSNSDGQIDFQEFLIGIRGKPNERRQAFIDRAFLKFDHDGSGVLDVAELRGGYNASLHPKVARGVMTEDQVFLEFLSNFANLKRDGSIFRQEWDEYYAAVSASMDNDEHFIGLLRQVWRLD
jgi:Ca2+-binding EF-hand superfamily protein